MNTDKLRLRRCRIKQVCDSSAPSGSAKNLVKGANNTVDNKRVSGQSQTSGFVLIGVYPRASAADSFAFTSAVGATEGKKRPSRNRSRSWWRHRHRPREPAPRP